jgi:hypothetical protein
MPGWRHFEDQRKFAEVLEGQSMLALETYELGGNRAADVLDVVRAHDLTIARCHGDWQFMETPDSKRATRIRQLKDALTFMSMPFSRPRVADRASARRARPDRERRFQQGNRSRARSQPAHG